jgi:PPE family protein
MNSRHNWDGYSHQTLYDRIHGKGGFFAPDGAGVSGAAGAQDGWADLASLMARARERTELALARAGAVWDGDAADAMRSGVTPLAQWADDAHTASTASQSSTDVHVSAYSAAKNTMPEPVRVTSTANGDYAGIPAGFTHLFGGQTDQDKQEAAAQEAKAEAVRVMSGYDVESGAARVSAGQFVPPPSVTVDVAPVAPEGGDVIPVGVSEWPGTGQVIEDGIRGPGGTPGPGSAPPPGDGSTPPPGGGSAQPPPDSVPSGATTPSVVTTVSPPAGPVTTGLGSDQVRAGSPPAPFAGFATGGGPGAGSAERDPFGGRGTAGGGGVAERGPGGPRGAGPGGGGPAGEPLAGRGGVAGARGTNGMGVAPVGGRGEGDEDREHRSAEYLIDFHDEFWDNSPPVAPSVIGDEEVDD